MPPTDAPDGEIIVKVSPYHTTSDEESAHNREVYHDHGNCEHGKQIKSWNKVPGTGERPQCETCIQLG